jgi:hypothetical protein
MHQFLIPPNKVGYCYESETNEALSRVGVYIKSDINFVRRTELEGVNQHIIVIDVIGSIRFKDHQHLQMF